MLTDFVRTGLDVGSVAEVLTMAGFEVESVETVEGGPVLDVSVMSNRGDGLSALGLAREILARDRESSPTDYFEQASSRFSSLAVTSFENPAGVEIATADCNRFACRYFECKQDVSSPNWVRRRLIQAGMRPLGLIVDLTNYLMLELGQPMHAYDFDKLIGGTIVVRSARKGERIRTLNGQNQVLSEGQMLICDAERPVGIAGVMGGAETEVTETTRKVLLESASFDAVSVRRTRKALDLNTEASYRFERHVDPDGAVAALERFAQIIGFPGSQIADRYPGRKEPAPVTLRVDRAVKLLGMPVTHEEAQRHLERLGMEVAGHGDPYIVVPPTWRPDVRREEDLVEELGRVHGYESIPEELPVGTTTRGGVFGATLSVNRLREKLLATGFSQMISHSLTSAHVLDTNESPVRPRNPVSPEHCMLRTSLLPGLSVAIQRNGSRDLHLFEIGRTFAAVNGGYAERNALAIISTGKLLPEYLKGELVPEADFFSLKGSLDGCLSAVGYAAVLESAISDARFHPTRQASIMASSRAVGVIGEIMPSICFDLGFPDATVALEIDLDSLFKTEPKLPQYAVLSRNPPVRRDVALLVDRSRPYAEIEDRVWKAADALLEEVRLFDLFEGATIPKEKRSLGISFTFRKHGANLTDEEANQARDSIVKALESLGAATR